MQTYSTQEELRDALKALPIHPLTARSYYYRLINGVGYEPNLKKRKGSADNVYSIAINGIDEGIGITGELFDRARSRAVARAKREREYDRTRADSLRRIAANAERYRVAAPATLAVLRAADAFDGVVIVDGTAVEQELATIDATGRGRTAATGAGTRAERNTPTLQTAGRRATGAAPALAR